MVRAQSPASRDISSCGVCHQPGRHVRTRETAPAFRVGFSHAKHDESEGLTCNECHRVRAGVAQRIQVTAPQPLNHHASPGAFSCVSCHNGKRAFGGDDFSVCTRCHTKTPGTFDNGSCENSSKEADMKFFTVFALFVFLSCWFPAHSRLRLRRRMDASPGCTSFSERRQSWGL